MKLRVFVIDDEESIRFSLKMHLEGLGHEVIVAENPMALLDITRNCGAPDLACADVYFVDQIMPEMTGLDFLKHTLDSPCQLPPANFILMSGCMRSEIQKLACQLGFTVVSKPMSLDDVDRLLESCSRNLSPSRRLSALCPLNSW